jgi:hypothetical protein
VVKAYFEEILKDPESARYKFDTPERAYRRAGWANRGRVAWQGYVIPVNVNAKNSYGGYTGYKRYFALMRDGRLSLLYEAKHSVITSGFLHYEDGTNVR